LSIIFIQYIRLYIVNVKLMQRGVVRHNVFEGEGGFGWLQ